MFVAPTTMYADRSTVASAPLPALPAQTLEQLWIAAGGDPRVAANMAAIALAESGGIPNAVNPSDNGGTQASWGLWQISNGTHEAPSPAWANPYDNAQMAVQKFVNAKGFSPWGTYGGATYNEELAAILSGAPSPSATSVTGPSSSSSDPYSTVSELSATQLTALAEQALGMNNLGGVGSAIDAAGGAVMKTTGAIMGSFTTMQNLWNNFGALMVGIALIFIGALLLAMMWGEDLVKVLQQQAPAVASTAKKAAEVAEVAE